MSNERQQKASRPRVLISGFGPFLDEKINPSEHIVHFVNSCESHVVTSLDVRGVVLPVEFDKAFERLKAEMSLFSPDVVLCFGLAGGSTALAVEQLAVNYRIFTGRDADIATIEGEIIPEAPLAFPTTLPVDDILGALKVEGIPAKRPFSAGTYVCNDLFFQLQNHLRFTRVRSGFIHVPRFQEGTADWSWSAFEKALLAILQGLVD